MKVRKMQTRIIEALEPFADYELSPIVMQLAVRAVTATMGNLLGDVVDLVGPKFDGEGRLLVRCNQCGRSGVLPLKR
jgi:hypothetical protein